MSPESSLWMFAPLIVLLFLGVPVAFALVSVALVFGLYRFGDAAVWLFAAKVQDLTTSHILAAAPLFIFMGAMLQRSGIADRLFDAIAMWTRPLPGGLAVASILMCVVFAASCGVVGATETVVGMLAIPVMLRKRYDPALISGTICAGGALGSMIPPSILLIILALIAEVGIGELFAGMVLPGLALAGCYVFWIIGRCWLSPALAPRDETSAPDLSLAARITLTLHALVPPFLLIAAVMGSILFGVAVATEAAAAGTIGSVLLAAFYHRLSWPVLREVMIETIAITAMILTIVLGGLMFSGVFVGLGGIAALSELIESSGLGRWGTLFIALGVTFIAGFVIDVISIILIVVPVSLPLMVAYGFDPLWFCILLVVVLQTSLLTPPMAGTIFYLRAVAPPEIKLQHMYRGVVPFIGLHFVVLAAIMIYPQMALWLPEVLIGFD